MRPELGSAHEPRLPPHLMSSTNTNTASPPPPSSSAPAPPSPPSLPEAHSPPPPPTDNPPAEDDSTTSPSEAYTQITSFFRTHADCAPELSVLPSPPFDTILTCDSPIAIGVPKSLLLAAFSVARGRFFTLLDSTGPNSTASDTCDGGSDAHARELLDTTLILLLTSAEHATALNTRKRLLVAGTARKEDELRLLECFLASALPKHNKSSTLWAHRRWVLGLLREEGRGEGMREGLEKELDLVRRSGMQHPRNYYAWNHARWALGFYPLPSTTDTDTDTDTVARILDAAKSHTLSNPSDVSAWTFLADLLQRLRAPQPPPQPSPQPPQPQPQPHPQSSPQSPRISESAAENLILETLDFARRFCRERDSAGVFFRRVVGTGEVLGSEARARVLQRLKEGRKDGEERRPAGGWEDGVEKWVRRWGVDR